MDKRAKEIQAEVNKTLGPDTVVVGSDLRAPELQRITSGSLSLDVRLGGGFFVNRWHEIYGNESSGKTMLVLKTIAANQARDPNWFVYWIAAEDFDPDYAAMCGCDLSRFLVYDDNVSEPAFQTALEALESRAFDCVVFDSMPALVPETEDEKEVGESSMMRQAFLNGQFLRKSRRSMKRSPTVEDRPVTGFMINQWRERVVKFGDPRITPGGRAKNYWFSSRLELVRDEWLEEGLRKNRVGQSVKALVFKNKSGKPQGVAVMDFYFSDFQTLRAGDYDRAKEIVALGVEKGVIHKPEKGAWYSYDEERWHGLPALMKALRNDEALLQLISKDVMAAIRPPEAPVRPRRGRKTVSVKRGP
jgi:recombination protein RecA